MKVTIYVSEFTFKTISGRKLEAVIKIVRLKP